VKINGNFPLNVDRWPSFRHDLDFDLAGEQAWQLFAGQFDAINFSVKFTEL
jgi:hypothetical protein